MAKSLAGRIALVTGASRGIGKAIALRLAQEGAHVIATARTVGGLEELDDDIQASGESATLVPLDIKDFAGIDRLGTPIAERWGKLDILVGNAGILGSLTPLQHLKPETFDDLMAINVMANYRLIRSLEPLIKASDAGRAIFVTSGAAHKARAYWGGYAVSKAALDMLVRTWAAELETTNATANLLNPGPIATRMRRQAMPGEDQKTLPTPEQLADAMISLCSADATSNGAVHDFKDGVLIQRN
ncbi:SDR family NAD(P)-dependent oxidoreductase [Anderseniella sp. Alg231-50]|uniref:SDR family NAD(P)-dependent oxidoreductase n=1 Tax=Anderseniella sp. Alg231-50 TaxID=1922226 RepID=UPI000D54E9F5